MIKFLGFNQIERATLTPSSENSLYPVSNIKDPRRTKVWRSTSNSDSIVIDFGVTVPIDSFCIVDHSLKGFGLSTLTVQLNQTNLWTAPPVSVTIPLDQEWGWGDYVWPSNQNYRFARIVCTSTLGYCEVSNCYFGLKTTAGNLDFTYPLNIAEKTNATIAENRYGQKFIDEVNTQKEFSGSINSMFKEEMESILELFEYTSTTRPLFVKFDCNIMTEMNRLNGMYYLKTNPNIRLGQGNLWDMSLNFDEAT